MPFKSQAQRRKFAEMLVRGEISPETFEEWNRETGSAKLPERVGKKRGGRKQSAKKKSAGRRKTAARRSTRTSARKSGGKTARKLAKKRAR